jgi:hypothetical protein
MAVLAIVGSNPTLSADRKQSKDNRRPIRDPAFGKGPITRSVFFRPRSEEPEPVKPDSQRYSGGHAFGQAARPDACRRLDGSDPCGVNEKKILMGI